MTNNDFAIAVTKFFYYAMDYPSVPITYPTLSDGEVTKILPDFFNAFEPYVIEHLEKRFDSCYEKYGCKGVMLAFYDELDGDNRMKLCRWINEHYYQREDFGITLEEEQDA